MASNKERIEVLEAGLSGFRDGIQQMERGVAKKLNQLEETINQLSEAMLSHRESPSHHNTERDGFSRTNRDDNDGGRSIFSSKMAKLEFPRYSGEDPTEWFNRVSQCFKYQGTPEAQKVSLASFHLEAEANQWW